MFKKTLAASALAALAIFAVVPAANAATYVPESNVTSASVAPGETGVAAFAANSFDAGSSVSFSVTGPGLATLSIVKAAQTATLTKTAAGTGAVSVNVATPAEAPGTYSVTAAGTLNGAAVVGTATVTAVAADAPLAGTGADKALASTGVNSPLLLIWAAAGVLLLGVAFLLVRNTVRRQGATA